MKLDLAFSAYRWFLLYARSYGGEGGGRSMKKCVFSLHARSYGGEGKGKRMKHCFKCGLAKE